MTDDDTLSDSDLTTVDVNDVAPVLTLNPVVAIDENGVATLSGTIADVGTLDTFTLAVNWGDPLSPNNVETYTYGSSVSQSQTFTLTHQYLDDNPSGDASNTYTIGVTLTDDDTGSVSDSTTTTISNVAPEITSFETDSPYCGGASEGETVTATLEFVDPGTLDDHQVVIDWGDGTVDTIDLARGDRSIQPTHSYAAGGVYQVTAVVTDDDTGTDTASATAVISGVGVVGNTLYVVGTPGDDLVTINQTGNGTIKVHANFLADSPRSVDSAGVAQINVILCWGNDQATIAGNILLPAIMDGGRGDDKLNGGGGGNVLLGGDGNDELLGGSRGDILIGGAGRDRLVGNPGEDVLIGGRSGLDSDPASGRLANDVALLAFLADWNSPLSRPARESALSGLIGSLTDDGDKDVLTGSSGEDWLFAGIGDVITGPPGSGKKK